MSAIRKSAPDIRVRKNSTSLRPSIIGKRSVPDIRETLCDEPDQSKCAEINTSPAIGGYLSVQSAPSSRRSSAEVESNKFQRENRLSVPNMVGNAMV
ncbi:DgyrCDS1049 [Dimorphilus gyrociliatus]|uniref:DgyrCDS1049 n=1 Tax=Dimorphilus gyrociliatus TaxID=2664684 RepID=A0A7I8V6G1_9ANNE|nr:DgyrCDS1049 [Dimorphilus gyrociliatus]